MRDRSRQETEVGSSGEQEQFDRCSRPLDSWGDHLSSLQLLLSTTDVEEINIHNMGSITDGFIRDLRHSVLICYILG